MQELVNAGTQRGVISCDLDDAFSKITEKFEQTPSTKVYIPGQDPIDVPIVDADSEHNLRFSAHVLLDLNTLTLKALQNADFST